MSKETKEHDQLFIGGDLSGIQKFLYNITSHEAMVSLIGRSNYLAAYMQDICNRVKGLPSLKAGNARDIYCSGGKFYVVAAYSEQALQELQVLIAQVKKDLWTEHRGELSINMGVVPFSENEDGTVNAADRSHSKCGILWELMTNEFSIQKNQKFVNEISDNFEDFFTPHKIEEKPKVCAVTGIESDECVEHDGVKLLPTVLKQITEGRRISRERGFKTFEEYAGDTYLGILRMDVDGLGTRFIKGFDSIKQYQEFSNHLTAFFENGILQDIQRKKEYCEFLNIVYAGGDDIFAVGRWDKLIDFAAEVSSRFANHVQGEGVSISGGIAIVHDKFPIAKAAEMSGEAEQAAKEYNNGAKNAFCMFGEPISWDCEYGYVKTLKDDFVHLITDCGLSRGILHKLMSYYMIIRRNLDRKRRSQKLDYSYMWHLPYYLTRYIGRQTDKESEVSKFCRELRDKELTKGDNNFRLVAVAARWAELTIRNYKN